MVRQVVDVAEMEQKGMGLIYGVGRAAPSPPRIVFLKYTGDPASSRTTALVGKGLCYDTGARRRRRRRRLRLRRLRLC